MALQQLRYLMVELRRMNKQNWWRWLNCWFNPGCLMVINYRLNRSLYLLLGERFFGGLCVPLSPFFFLLRPWLGRTEIHYKADIGPGLLILHPSLGVVITAFTIAGVNLTLTGGNCIGRKRQKIAGGSEYVQIGDYVTMGVNASIIGPLIIGYDVLIGAGAVVVKNVANHTIVAGVPAVPIFTAKES